MKQYQLMDSDELEQKTEKGAGEKGRLWGSQEIEGKTKKPGHGKGRGGGHLSSQQQEQTFFSRDVHLRH